MKLKLIIIVKVLDTGGGGGIYGDEKKFRLNIANESKSLEGEWLYKVSVSSFKLLKTKNDFSY